jgi:beta-phosphoglucomutase-like phosphatase (HAD superfamily)
MSDDRYEGMSDSARSLLRSVGGPRPRTGPERARTARQVARIAATPVVAGGLWLSWKGALLQVCRDFDVEPARVVAIGDSSNDAEAARAAGCFVLSVPYGYNHGKPVQSINSDGIVGSLLEAAELISAHNKANS